MQVPTDLGLAGRLGAAASWHLLEQQGAQQLPVVGSLDRPDPVDRVLQRVPLDDLPLGFGTNLHDHRRPAQITLDLRPRVEIEDEVGVVVAPGPQGQPVGVQGGHRSIFHLFGGCGAMPR